MNFYLISLIDRILEEAMIKFSKFPRGQSAFYYDQDEFLLRHTRKIVDFYMMFFSEIDFLSVDYDYYKSELLQEVNLENKEFPESDILLKRLTTFPKIKRIELPFIKDEILPVHLHCSTKSEILLIMGIVVLEKGDINARFILHKVGVPRSLIKPAPRHLQYLHKVLERYESNKQMSMDKLLRYFDKNYNQFQRDCKHYFGDTFYQFYTKKRMIDGVGDILFSKLSLKEIAYKNSFSDYNSMYKVFKKYDNLTLVNIPRFLQDI
ncbi:AraC family transcriptional regulator [Galbibacter sp. EGI 63066]|uniref:helix-turn-helix domain-containing protein n=1 Tax=Galbibacter sp. EGI 63066 TaxID=2993559 RepID=UPI002248CD4A|nr:AraC family transcriptional regulator [Galbibacter sp. EGI 63066]MCX2680741.1 AraC family transcriptional regulator [Galbibacter sp. EGI 63066]